MGNASQFGVRERGAEMRLIAYERVSTARQGRSGLGLDAQRHAIEGFAADRNASVIARFTEVESGRRADRPELLLALQLSKLTGATLVIAKLDRLSRNAAFLLTLRDSGARFLAVDMPEANDLTIGIMALVAQQEREAISRRTKEALAIAKARGVKLGNPNGAAAFANRLVNTMYAVEVIPSRVERCEYRSIHEGPRRPYLSKCFGSHALHGVRTRDQPRSGTHARHRARAS